VPLVSPLKKITGKVRCSTSQAYFLGFDQTEATKVAAIVANAGFYAERLFEKSGRLSRG
jgi:hypothetical protein